MVKKSIIGIVLLSCMIFVKAFLIDKSEVSDLLVRDSSVLSEKLENQTLREETPFQIQGLLASLVKNISAEDIKLDQTSWQNQKGGENTAKNKSGNELVDVVQNQPEVSDSNDNLAENTEDIIPMDYVSNTGYGLLVSDLSAPSGASKSELSGNVPLDRGSTITESMSKLFPRTPH